MTAFIKDILKRPPRPLPRIGRLASPAKSRQALLTCEAVVAEAAFHLASSCYVLRLFDGHMLRIAFDCAPNLQKLNEIARRYPDHHRDFADLYLIRMSELYPQYPHSHRGPSRLRFYLSIAEISGKSY